LQHQDLAMYQGAASAVLPAPQNELGF